VREGHRTAEPAAEGFAQNQVWCEIVALACELLAWMQLLALTGRLSSVNAEWVSSRR
jgi:hypothetical protein